MLILTYFVSFAIIYPLLSACFENFISSKFVLSFYKHKSAWNYVPGHIIL